MVISLTRVLTVYACCEPSHLTIWTMHPWIAGTYCSIDARPGFCWSMAQLVSAASRQQCTKAKHLTTPHLNTHMGANTFATNKTWAREWQLRRSENSNDTCAAHLAVSAEKSQKLNWEVLHPASDKEASSNRHCHFMFSVSPMLLCFMNCGSVVCDFSCCVLNFRATISVFLPLHILPCASAILSLC